MDNAKGQHEAKTEVLRIGIHSRAEGQSPERCVYCIQATIGEIVWFFALLGKEMGYLRFSRVKFG